MDSAKQRECFERWLREHAAIPHHTANAFAESPADRQDLTQEMLLALWRSIPAFRGESKVSTFIYRVCHNTALTWKRAERNRQRRVERFHPPVSETLSAPPPAADRKAELLERLYAEIRRLPPPDRSLILLSLDGLSYREMAAIQGVGESAVGARLSRLKQKLATALTRGAHAHESR